MATFTAPNQVPVQISQVVDLQLTATGDLFVDKNGDFALIRGVPAVHQMITFRLLTLAGDARYDPRLGASLQTLMGQPVSAATADSAETLIKNALTYDGLFTAEDIEVIASPDAVNPNQMNLVLVCNLNNFVGVDPNQQYLNIRIGLDLQAGLLV